jgi:hypothetical protein
MGARVMPGVSYRMYHWEKLPSLMEVIQMFKSRQLRCSFCGKNETEVEKLVAGQRAFICDGCVAIASLIMNDPRGDQPPPGVRCSSWRRLLTTVRQIFRGDGARRVGGAVSL